MYLVVALIIGYFLLGLSMMAAFASAGAAAIATSAVALADASTRSFRRYTGLATVDDIGIEPPRPRPDRAEGVAGDPAYRSYLFGPAYREAVLVGREAVDATLTRVRQWLNLSARHVRDHDGMGAYRWVSTFLIGVGIQAGILAGLAVGWTLMALVGVVFAFLLFAVGAVVVVVGAVMQLAERLVLVVRGITAACPVCQRHTRLPVYRCSGEGGCRAAHHALLPSSRGVFGRICSCGRRLPTMLLFGKHFLDQQCPHCKAEMPREGMSAPPVDIPVVGGPQVGKTVFMFAAVHRLHTAWKEGGARTTFFGDEEFVRRYDAAQPALLDPSLMLKTTESHPKAWTMYLGSGKLRRRLVYLYDAAGETFESADDVAAVRFLSRVGGVVLCVDPFALGGCRREAGRADLDRLRSRATDPRVALNRLTEVLREAGRAKGSSKLPIRLAVVLTKADGLEQVGIRHPYDGTETSRAGRSAAVRAWIGDIGARPDLVASLEANYAEVGYFVLDHRGAQASGQGGNDSPADPVQWLLPVVA